jgi:integrase
VDRSARRRYRVGGVGGDVPFLGAPAVTDDPRDLPADLTLYVLPRFGSYRLGRLPAEEIEEWLNDEIEQGLAPSSVHRHYRTLRGMLQVAVDKQKIVGNPCDRVQPPRVPKREMVFLDWDQVVLLAEAHQPRFRALIYVAAETGMRWSELIGLRRSKVDLRGRKIRVTEQLVQLQDGSFVRKEPKTAASVRSISISEAMTASLVGHLREFCSPGPDALVFTNGAGSPIASSSFLSQHLRKAQNATGVSCRFHDLRHTSVAWPSPRAPIPRQFRRGWATRR